MAIKIVKKTWGREEWIENNKKYCGKLLVCKKNKWSSQGKYHYHKKKDETFYVIEGKLSLDVEGELHLLQKGDSVRLKPNTRHRFKSLTKQCKIIEFSTHHEDSDSYYDRN